jgi:hypothetical protein
MNVSGEFDPCAGDWTPIVARGKVSYATNERHVSRLPPATVLARIVILSPACVAIHGLSGFQEKAPRYRAKAAVPGNERIGGRMSHVSHPRRYGHEQDGVY